MILPPSNFNFCMKFFAHQRLLDVELDEPFAWIGENLHADNVPTGHASANNNGHFVMSTQLPVTMCINVS